MSNIIKEQVNGFLRQLTITPPFDKRHSGPDKNYGIHGMDLKCVLSNNKKAVQFLCYLPVYLPRVGEELFNNTSMGTHNPFKGMGADVGYHSPVPMYDGQSVQENCQYTGGNCYYDGSSLTADEWYKVFLEEGLDAIWKKLEKLWSETFQEAK